MAKKRIRTRSKSNKRRPYKKRTQKKRKKSTKRGGAAVNPAPQIPAAPELPPELIQEQVQIPERQVGDCTPPNCENCKNTFEELECTGVERRSFSDEEGAELTRTTTRREDIPPINQVEWGSLDSEKKKLFESLGWVNMEENDLLILGPMPYSQWGSLEPEYKGKVTALGYDEESWDEIDERRRKRQLEGITFIEGREPPPLGTEGIPPINQVEWGDLVPEKKELAESLGWVDMKDNDLLIEGPKSLYEWRNLDYRDQDKAISLGYDEKSWNEMFERRVRQSEQFPERGDQPFRRTDSDVTVGEGELKRETTPALPGNTEEVERLIRNLISLLREEYKKYVDKYYSNENKTPEEKKQDYMDFLDEYYGIILNKEEDLLRLLH